MKVVILESLKYERIHDLIIFSEPYKKNTLPLRFRKIRILFCEGLTIEIRRKQIKSYIMLKYLDSIIQKKIN